MEGNDEVEGWMYSGVEQRKVRANKRGFRSGEGMEEGEESWKGGGGRGRCFPGDLVAVKHFREVFPNLAGEANE